MHRISRVRRLAGRTGCVVTDKTLPLFGVGDIRLNAVARYSHLQYPILLGHQHSRAHPDKVVWLWRGGPYFLASLDKLDINSPYQ